MLTLGPDLIPQVQIALQAARSPKAMTAFSIDAINDFYLSQIAVMFAITNKASRGPAIPDSVSDECKDFLRKCFIRRASTPIGITAAAADPICDTNNVFA